MKDFDSYIQEAILNDTPPIKVDEGSRIRLLHLFSTQKFHEGLHLNSLLPSQRQGAFSIWATLRWGMAAVLLLMVFNLKQFHQGNATTGIADSLNFEQPVDTNTLTNKPLKGI